jgi:hypothetical protein
MARVKLSRFLYALALVAMPLSYALKELFGLYGVAWVDPTLILGLLVFLLTGFPMKEKAPLWVLISAFLSALIGILLMIPSADREKSATYVVFVEPVRLGLSMIWFWVSIRFFKSDKQFVLRWLVACVAWEFSVACYLYFAFYDLVPVPEVVKPFLEVYKTKQALFWGDLAIYRMAGTFIESPPFGLFMLSCFVIFALALISSSYREDRRFRKWLLVGAICAFLGSLGSLSDQTIVALLILGLTLALVRTSRNKAARTVLWSSLILVLALYSATALVAKWKGESVYSGDPIGTSIGERTFHTRYALGLFIEQPVSLITGIGPGRYGDYAVRTGYFPSTVAPQVTIIEWAVEYGFLGLLLIGLWLFRVGSRAVLGFGIVGGGALAALLTANMFQANWKWESWFLALAFLYTTAHIPPLKTGRSWKPKSPSMRGASTPA